MRTCYKCKYKGTMKTVRDTKFGITIDSYMCPKCNTEIGYDIIKTCLTSRFN